MNPRHVRGLPGGGARIRLATAEHDLLRSVAPRVRPLVAGEQDVATPDGPLSARLHPPGYDDPVDEIEFRELLGDDAARGRVAALTTLAASLERGEHSWRGWTVDLDTDETNAWLSAVNDARLVLAGVVGVTEEQGLTDGPDPTDADSVALYWLGYLEEQLVALVAGRLGG